MSSRLNLKPGNVYFLRMLDHSGSYEFPYVKVGITEGVVARRIDQLQTGNPFQIVDWSYFHSEAAQLVERHIHHTFAERRVRLEWLGFTEQELPDLLARAKAYSAEVSAKAEVVRASDRQASNGTVIDASDETRTLHGEIVTLLGAQVEAKGRFDASELTLKTLTGTTSGIEGVTEVTITKAGRGFSASQLKKAEPDLHTQYCLIEELGCSFSFVGKPRINAYPEVQTALKEAKAAVMPVAVADVTLSIRLPRSDEIEALHTEYVNLKAKLAEIQGDLVRYELELRHACGENEGIDEICSYKREPKKKFDEQAFKKDHPDLWESCHVDRPSQRRIKVLPSRDYA